MARFIAYFDPFKKIPTSVKQNLELACLFLSKTNNTELNYQFIEGLNGHFKGMIVFSPNEMQRVYSDSNITIIADGNPLVGDKFVNAGEIANLYNNYGLEQTLKKLDGGHLELIIDEKNMDVSIVRDRLGLKSVYYVKNNDAYIISSNIGAIIKTGLIDIKENENIIAKYANCGYQSIYGGTETFIKNINLASPSTINKFSKKGISITKYWDFSKNSGYMDLNHDEVSANYINTISNSVENILIASENNKPIVTLGGGVDSGAILGMLHRLKEEKVDAISLSYNEETDFDESFLIQKSVKDHVQNWHDIKLDPNVLLNDLEGLYNYFDLPLATISSYGYLYLYREINKLGYEVVFNGSGGDQVQAGNYPSFFYHFADLKYSNDLNYELEVKYWIQNHSTKQFPKTLKTVEEYFIKHIDFNIQGKLKSYESYLTNNNILSYDIRDKAGRLVSEVVSPYGSYLKSYMVQEFYHDALAPLVESQNTIDWVFDTSTLSPFNSKDIVDFGWHLPSKYKIKNGINKVLSRTALRGICSDEILDRVSKSGFNAPFDIWLRGPLKEFTMDVFRSKKFQERGIYDLIKFDRVISEHMNKDKNHMAIIWQALNQELWMKNWLDCS
jgi:asparagine synthase (glutamine-hydrolysing)